MTRTDLFHLLWPTVCAILLTLTFYFKGSELDTVSLACGAAAMFGLGLVVKTKGERLIIRKLDSMKKEIDELK